MVLTMESRTLRQPSLEVGIVVLLTNSSSFNTPHAILVAPMSTPLVALILLLRTSTFPGRPQHRAATNQGKTQISNEIHIIQSLNYSLLCVRSQAKIVAERFCHLRLEYLQRDCESAFWAPARWA